MEAFREVLPADLPQPDRFDGLFAGSLFHRLDLGCYLCALHLDDVGALFIPRRCEAVQHSFQEEVPDVHPLMREVPAPRDSVGRPERDPGLHSLR